MLLIVVGSVLLKGVGALSIHFLTTPTALFNESGGGISNAIVGTAIMVGLAALMAIPVGLLVAIYTTEFAPPPDRPPGPVRARRAQRGADDHHRDLRLWPDR